MKKSLYLALIACLSLQACDDNNPNVICENGECIDIRTDFKRNEMSIINGTRVTGSDYQSTVLLYLDYGSYIGKSSFCTGTLISPDWVLTAAHCVTHCADDDPSEYIEQYYNDSKQYVYAAVTNTLSGVTSKNSFAVKKAIPHPNFYCSSTNIKHDIALLHLEKEVPLSLAQPTPPIPPVKGIQLTASEVDSAFNVSTGATTLPLTTVGFGKTNAYNDNSTGVKYKTTPSTFAYCPLSGSQGYYCGVADNGTSEKGFIYFLGYPSGTCQGDSGGPTFFTRNGIEYVVGVTSFGFGNCDNIEAATNVADYYDFIQSNVPNLAANTPENCTNGKDDNGDGRIDCLDPYCYILPQCILEDCTNGKDDNGDGKADCLDPQCSKELTCQPEDCSNGIDDNGNGKVDCLDPECTRARVCQPEDCTNGEDDNDDGLADCDDPQCSNALRCRPEVCDNGFDDNGNNLIDCDDPQCSEAVHCQTEICNNKIDDNGNNLIDCDDPQCSQAPHCKMEICDNKIDDNVNGLIDCDDPQCAQNEACTNQATTSETEDDTNKKAASSCSATPKSGPASNLPWFLLGLTALPALLRRRRDI